MNVTLPAGFRSGLLRAAAVALFVICIAEIGVLRPVERILEDAMLRGASRLQPASARYEPGIAVVAVDPQSLRELGGWPWPRSRYAETVEQLTEAGARAIAFDIDFSSPQDPAEDAAFAEAMRNSGRVVLAAFRQDQKLAGGVELEIANLPDPSLAQAAAAVGSVLVRVSPDGIVRKARPYSEIGGSLLPSMSAAALGIATSASGVEAERDARQGSVTGAKADWQRIDFRRAEPPYPVLPISDVISGRFDPRDVAGRVVFIGATAAEFQDLWNTPLAPAVPGVHVQAVFFRTLVAQGRGETPLTTLVRGERAALLLLLSLLLAPLGGVSPRLRMSLSALAAILIAGGAFATVAGSGRLVAPLLPLSIVAVHYLLGMEVVRVRVEKALALQRRTLSALEAVGHTTTGSDSGDPLAVSLSLLADVVGARGVALFRCGPEGALDGRRLEWSPGGEARVGDQRAAEHALDTGDRQLYPAGSAPGQGCEGPAVYLPLRTGAIAVGVLAVECAAGKELQDTELRTIATVGTQVALSAGNLHLIEELKETFSTSICAVASAVEARDGYTDMHCRRLAAFSRVMAARLGLSEEKQDAIELGALLHDVGKIGIRDDVLLKPGRFTPEERRDMERHPEIGERIVGPIHGLSPITLACIRHHHEHWDGGGYPDRLVGAEIPIEARIVAVVDVWDALSSKRPYKAALPQHKVLEILEKGRGAQFDPAVLDLFLSVLDEQGEEMLSWLARDADRTDG